MPKLFAGGSETAFQWFANVQIYSKQTDRKLTVSDELG